MSPGWYVPSISARCSRGRMDWAEPSTSSTLRPSTPGAPLLRTTFSRAVARFAGDATASSSRLASAALAPRSLAVLRFAVCSRKSLPADASDGPDFPPPCGLAANTKLNWRDLILQKPIAPFAPPAFTGFIATMRRSDFSSGFGPASLPSWVLPSPDRRRSLGVRMSDFPSPPPPTPSCRDWIPGVALRRTLAQAGRPYGGSLSFGAAVRLGLPSHTPSRERSRLCNASLDLVQLPPASGCLQQAP